MALKLPRISTIKVVPDQQPSREFSRLWDTFAKAIEQAFSNIDTINTDIDGIETDLTTVEADVDGATASGLFRAVQGATSGGADATIELQVRANTGNGWSSASIKISATGGAGGSSRIEISAGEVVIDGTLLNNGAIVNSHLGTNAVTTAKITAGAVTTGVNQAGAGPTTIPASGALTTLASGSYTASGGSVLLDIETTCALTAAGSVTVDFEVQLDGVLVAGREMANLVFGSPQQLSLAHDGIGDAQFTTFFLSSSAGSHTWALKASTPDGIDVTATNFRLNVRDWQR